MKYCPSFHVKADVVADINNKLRSERRSTPPLFHSQSHSFISIVHDFK